MVETDRTRKRELLNVPFPARLVLLRHFLPLFLRNTFKHDALITEYHITAVAQICEQAKDFIGDFQLLKINFSERFVWTGDIEYVRSLFPNSTTFDSDWSAHLIRFYS